MDSTGGTERALRLGTWLVVASVGTLMVTQAFGWAGTRIIAVAQSLTPYGIVLLAPLSLIAARRQQQRLGFTAALVGISGVIMAVPLVFAPGQPPVADAANGVRVAAVNLLYSNDTIDDAADTLLALGPDVIVFSEYTAAHRRALSAHPLAEHYPERIDRPGYQAGGMAVWSRHRLRQRAPLPTLNHSVDITVEGPDGPFEMVGVHPPAPVFDFESWRADLGLLHDRAGAASEPTLLIGDLNASFWHPLFRDLLDAGFVDAHMAHGRGFSTSWPTGDWRPAFVRLDHALTGHGLVSTEIVDFDVPGSDHRGLVVTVAPAR